MDALELSRGTASIGIRIIHAVLRGTILAALSETIKALSKNHPDYPIRSSAEGTQFLLELGIRRFSPPAILDCPEATL
jgi:hypothetical protein